MMRKTSRRDLLKRGAIATASASVLGGGPLLAVQSPSRSTADAQARPGRGRFDADVVVVGAGYAGLVAAHRLRQAGRSVIVVEAMDRVGGRSLTTTLSDGMFLDIGAGWTGSTEFNILQLIKEFGLQTYTQYGLEPGTGQNLFVAADGTVTPYDDIPPLSDEALIELGAAIATIDTLGETVPLEAPWTAPNAAEWDSISAGVFLQQTVQNPEAFAFVMGNLTSIFALNPFAVSFLQTLWISHTGGGITKFGIAEAGATQFRIVGGTQQIPLGIIQRLPRRSLVLNSPVRDILQDDRGVTVISERATHRARRVIVAVPTCVSSYIRYTPALPPDRAQLIQRYPLGSAMKLQLVYDRAFWRDAGLNGNSFALGDVFIGQTVDAGGPSGDDEPGILGCFPDDDAARDLGRMTRDERLNVAIQELTPRFGPQIQNLSKTINPNYIEFIAEDLEWVRGDYGGQPGPRVLTASGFGPAIREPVGRIHWAGVDTSTNWYGTIQGAAQSGERAAVEAIKAGL